MMYCTSCVPRMAVKKVSIAGSSQFRFFPLVMQRTTNNLIHPKGTKVGRGQENHHFRASPPRCLRSAVIISMVHDGHG